MATAVSLTLLMSGWLQTLMAWAGVLFLLYMGWVTWRSTPAVSDAEADEWPARRQVLFAATVSLLNPHAILDTVAVIGGNATAYAAPEAKLAFTLACIAVSWLWFSALSAAGHLLGVAGDGVTLRRWLNRVSAVIMWGVAVQLLLQQGLG